MSRNKLVSDLFEQEFNKEENYKAIMRRIEEEEKKKQKKPIWKPALAVLGVVVIVAAAFLLFPKGNKQLEEKPQVTETPTPDQQVDDLYINELGSLEVYLIDTPWRNVVKKNPDITNSAFTIVDEINKNSLNGEKGLIFGGYEDDKLVEYVIAYNNESKKKLTFDVTLKDFEPKYLKYTYGKDVITNELSKAKKSSIAGQSLTILHFDSKYYLSFVKNNLVFDVEFEGFSKQDLEKIINIIFG